MPRLSLHSASSSPTALLLAALASSPAGAQTFVVNTDDVPSNSFVKEQVDFSDIDLDGDFDCAFAVGGANRRNRIWVSRGGLQPGTVGSFMDQTSTRTPDVTDTSRDVEFIDFDSDGDPDLFVANSSYNAPNTSRWWTNQGGSQGGTLGFYTDDTDARWVDLFGPTTSLPASQAAQGGFLTYTSDGEFADLDNDGDLDLVHSAYGPGLAGQMPTRLFFNDGDGYFSEYNPSFHKLTGANIFPGEPGLWCDGVQQADTVNTTGAFCDIATSAADVDVGGRRRRLRHRLPARLDQRVPRLFANRFNGSNLCPRKLGFLTWRDVTHLAFPSGYAGGNLSNWEQELGDLDGDGDPRHLGLELDHDVHRAAAVERRGWLLRASLDGRWEQRGRERDRFHRHRQRRGPRRRHRGLERQHDHLGEHERRG